MRIPHLIATLFLSACTVSVPPAAQAAQSYDNCAHFIDTLPAVIDQQGVYCLRHDLSTGVGAGSAIEVQANNVTIDCNDFKLGGLAVGSGSLENGIYAHETQNTTIRRCNIRGFVNGIDLSGGGHLVEDNLLDGNLYIGIAVAGDNNLVRRNRVFDTGESTVYPTTATGILASADIVDNIVDGVTTAGTTDEVTGIQSKGEGTRVMGNRVGGLKLNAGGAAHGIFVPDGVSAHQQSIVGNHVAALDSATAGVGIRGIAGAAMLCANNVVTNFTTAYQDCTLVDGTYNASH